MHIKQTTLQGRGVRLEPLTQEHLSGLAEAILDGELWKIPVTSVPHPVDLPQFLQNTETLFREGKELTFATIDDGSGKVVGSTSFRNINSAHKRVEIGFTFIAQSWQRSHINTEAKYLMFTHAFEQWQCNRVELLTDFLNLKSRAAITRIGAREEGILRSHMLMRDGRIRDSVIFSLIASEWPQAKARMEAWLHTDNYQSGQPT